MVPVSFRNKNLRRENNEHHLFLSTSYHTAIKCEIARVTHLFSSLSDDVQGCRWLILCNCLNLLYLKRFL